MDDNSMIRKIGMNGEFKMFRIASVSLFAAYIFLLKFVSISQTGPDWEIPYAILRKSRMMLVLGVLFTIVSFIFVIISYRSFEKCRIYIKVIYICLLMIALGVSVLGFNGVFYQLPVYFPVLSNILKCAFWPGVTISLSLILLLLVGNKNVS